MKNSTWRRRLTASARVLYGPPKFLRVVLLNTKYPAFLLTIIYNYTMRKLVLIILFGFVILGGLILWNKYKGIWFANVPSKQDIVQLINNVSKTPGPGENKTSLPLKIPDAYTLSIYAANLTDPRDLIFDPNGTIMVSLTSAGKVVAVNGNRQYVVAEGLDKPHGLAFNGNKLYIAETNQVAIYDYDPVNYKASNKKKIIDLPGNGEHFTRSLLVTAGKLYVSIGSDCNACTESDSRRAAIWQANLDGSNFRLYSKGLRNSVFMEVNPMNGEIWATNMGRDFLGDNLPPDTINIIRDGADYGWPYCYGNKVTDSQTNSGNSKFDCSKMEAPKIEIQAHSAPLGLAFLGSDLLVAYHGSWNRSVPTGYKVVKFHNGVQEDFITGWLQPNGDVLGRPVDILVKGNGNEIFISDDKAGVIYLLKSL